MKLVTILEELVAEVARLRGKDNTSKTYVSVGLMGDAQDALNKTFSVTSKKGTKAKLAVESLKFEKGTVFLKQI